MKHPLSKIIGEFYGVVALDVSPECAVFVDGLKEMTPFDGKASFRLGRLCASKKGRRVQSKFVLAIATGHFTGKARAKDSNMPQRRRWD